jgi:rSAM/selenodomain-associated transferase 2
MKISIVIPVLNEISTLPACLESAGRIGHEPLLEVIVADGGSDDGTREAAAAAGAVVLQTLAGRGQQLNAGGRVASGDWLLFLHADTRLPEAWREAVETVEARGFDAATFRLRFDWGHPVLRMYSFFTRFQLPWTRFGDQGILVKTSLFERLGGFRPWPAFEDVDFLDRLLGTGRVCKLPVSVTTSARKFRRKGPLKQQLHNGWLLCHYRRGVDPEALARAYAGGRWRIRPPSRGTCPSA